MSKKSLPVVTAKFDVIVGGGQSLATLDDGRKLFAWGALPGETATVQVTKKKSSFYEGYATEIIVPSDRRVELRDPESYLSTSPWQIMDFESEQHYKAALIEEAFELHDIVLPNPISIYSDNVEYGYRNKIEYSFWYDTEHHGLNLAFFRRGSHGKIPINSTSLASKPITELSHMIRDTLRSIKAEGRSLKTLLIRSNRAGDTTWQLYVKKEDFDIKSLLKALPESVAQSGEVIFSNPRSPASVITKRLYAGDSITLSDELLGVPFHYATESFFQINLPVYEQALKDMREWVIPNRPTVDMYSGVGTIGLTIGGNDTTLVEVNEYAVSEMKRNIAELGINAEAVLAPSEKALDYIVADKTIIVDPPRAGMHEDVVNRLLEVKPERIIYLSCNPVTQARDVARLASAYGIKAHQGYNFFPRTPHIENLVVLDLVSH